MGGDNFCPAGQNPQEPSQAGGGDGTNPRSGQPNVRPPGIPANKGFKLPVDVGLSYSPSGTGGNYPVNGDRWVSGATSGICGGMPPAGPATGQVTYMKSPTNIKGFIPPSSSSSGAGGKTTFGPDYFVKDQLSYDNSSSSYTLMSPGGAVKKFDQGGLIQSFSDASGNVGTYTYSGTRVASIAVASGTDSNNYAYSYNIAGQASDIVYSVNGRAVLKTSYGYDGGGNLQTVQIFENSAAIGVTPVWGTAISSTLYTYHTGTKLIRHVVPPEKWRQMVNNGITNPVAATETQLNAYAATEYAYGPDNKVSVMYTMGRRYQYQFSYHINYLAGTSFNEWASRTDVIQPDGSLKGYYYSPYGQLILLKVTDSAATPTKVWYPIYQQFEEGSARIVLSADSKAIQAVSELNPNLVTLQASQGRLRVYAYTSDGDLQSVSLKNGTSGTAVPQQTLTYTTRTVLLQGSIRKIASETSYRNDNGTGAITTSYAYTWQGSTFQIDTLTTTLPVVGTGENGTGATYTTELHYDASGFLVKSVDERGHVTTYTYDQARGGMTQMVRDQGTGKLNLTTDYQLDDRGRTIRELGPVHSVDISGTSTSIRTARWTYYKDEEDGNWTFQGYRKVSDSSDHILGPVTVTQPNLAPPSGYSGFRQSSAFDAVYSGSGIPSPSDPISIFPQSSSWVRWSLDLIDTAGERTKQWNYFAIPSSGYGAVTTNFGEKQFFYDSAGRQNMTTCAGGTTDKTTYNAMSWAVQEELGVLPSLTVTQINTYDDNGNQTKVTLPVDATSAHDRVTDNTYDWRIGVTEPDDGRKRWRGHLDTHRPPPLTTIANLRTESSTYHTSVQFR